MKSLVWVKGWAVALGLFFLPVFLAPHVLTAQERHEYVDEKDKPCQADEAYKHRIITQTDTSWQVQEFLVRPKVLLMASKGTGHRNGEQGTFETRQYYQNGQLKSVMQVKEGYFEGMQMKFYPNGMLRDSFYYHKSLPVGTQSGWYPDGSLRFEMLLDSNHLGQGVCVGLFPNGQVAFKGRLAPGLRKTSDWFYYREDGSRSAVYRFGPMPDSLQGQTPVWVQSNFEGILFDTLVKPKEIYWYNAAGERSNAASGDNHGPKFGKKPSVDWSQYLQVELQMIMRFTPVRNLVYESCFVVGSNGQVEMIGIDKKNLDNYDYGIKRLLERAHDWSPAFYANRFQPYVLSQSLRLGFDQ